MDHVVVPVSLPMRCIMVDVEVLDEVEVLDPLICPIMFLVAMFESLRHSATDPKSKYTCLFKKLHLFMRLWLYDGLVASDQDRISFLSKWLVQHDTTKLAHDASNAYWIRSNVLSLGRSNFPHWRMVMPSNTYFKQDGHWVVVSEVCVNSISSTLRLSWIARVDSSLNIIPTFRQVVANRNLVSIQLLICSFAGWFLAFPLHLARLRLEQLPCILRSKSTSGSR